MTQYRYVMRVALTVAMGGFLMGFDASVISGVVKFIELQFDLSKIELGWAVSSLTLTSTLAMMVSGQFGMNPATLSPLTTPARLSPAANSATY